MGVIDPLKDPTVGQLSNDGDTILVYTNESEWEPIVTSNGTPVQIETDRGAFDIDERLRDIERAVGIPERDYNLEEKHPHLRELFYGYIRKLNDFQNEQNAYVKELERLKTFERLKKV